MIVEIIKNLLENEFSGGEKLIKLLPELIEKMLEFGKEIPEFNEILGEIEKSNDLKLLKYHKRLREGQYREKYFVYLNIP